jgi:outer membrane protein
MPRALALSVLLALPSLSMAEGPLTLDDALALASRQNPDLAIAREDATAASADKSTAWAGVLPRLDVQSSLGQSRFSSAVDQIFIDPITNQPVTVAAGTLSVSASYSFSANLRQTLFDWAAFRNISRASAAATAAQREYDETVLGTAFEVTRRYHELVRAERTLAVFEKTAARTEELVRRVDALYPAGKATRADTYTNRVNLGNDRIAVERQRAVVMQARTSMGQVLGMTDAEAAGLEVAVPAGLDGAAKRPPDPPPAEAVLEVARKRRPSLAAAHALVVAADAAIGAQQAGYAPTVSAQLGYFRTGSQLSGDAGVYSDPTKGYSATAQVVLSWNLFQGLGTSAAVQKAESQVRRARASEERALQAVSKEIFDARAMAASAALQVGLAADNLATAENALALARERLETGLATQLEVREANLNLTRAELSLVEARIAHAEALADMARASGGPL